MFDYNTAHHSWRRFCRVSVCTKLSYARDSWQTLVQTTHGSLGNLGSASFICPRQRCEDQATLKKLKTIQSAHRVQRRSYFVFEAIVQRPLEDNSSNTMTNGDLCDIHRCLSWQLTLQSKENSRLYKCLRLQYFACTATI